MALQQGPHRVAALLRIGWTVKREAGTFHRVLGRPDWPDFVFAFHDQSEIGPKMLARGVAFVMVSPSDRSIPFYGRAGFSDETEWMQLTLRKE